MIARVRARFAEGVLKPLDHLDLEDGAEVIVSIEDGGIQTVATEGSEEATGTPSSGYLLKSQREAAKRLIAMGGSAPDIEDIPRRRSNRLTEPGRAEDEGGR